MIQSSTQSELESLISLEKVVKQNGENLLGWQLEDNIVNNLVNVMAVNQSIQSIGTGLLLTTDGFVLTAYHNIENYLQEWDTLRKEMDSPPKNLHSWMNDMATKHCVIDKWRIPHPIDVSFKPITDPSYDLALIKSVILGKSEPTCLRFIDKELGYGDGIKLFGLNNQRAFNQFGKVIRSEQNTTVKKNTNESSEITITYDTFLTDAYSVPGFSGGVFTTLKGEFAGLSLFGQNQNERGLGHAGGAKASNILKFLEDANLELMGNYLYSN